MSQVGAKHVEVVVVVLLIFITLQHLARILMAVALDEETDYIVELILQLGEEEQAIVEEKALRHFVCEEIAEIATLWEQTEEAKQILKIDSADIGRRFHLILIHLLYHHCLTTIQHLANVLRNLVQNTFKSQ